MLWMTPENGASLQVTQAWMNWVLGTQGVPFDDECSPTWLKLNGIPKTSFPVN